MLSLAFPLSENPDEDLPVEWMCESLQDQADDEARKAGLIAGPVRFVEITRGLYDEHGHYVVDENGIPLAPRVARFHAECHTPVVPSFSIRGTVT